MSGLEGFARGLLGQAAVDYAQNRIPGVDGITTDVKMGKEFKESARPLNDAEEAFMKEMKAAKLAPYVGEKAQISPKTMENIDDMKSFGEKMHPAVKDAYDEVMKNPSSFGLKVERDGLAESASKMAQGASRGFDFSVK